MTYGRICALLLLLPALSSAASPIARVNYRRDVRPILSENCFYCHGQDANKRKAKLQLNTREGQRAKKAVVPGEPDNSGLVRRIFSTDKDEQMPPPDSHRALTAVQKDLLPNATVDQKIATGFNRNHMLNGEGGAIPEEQRHVILFDRVDTTATTWLGLTVACAQCHDHKYDPITQRDYYSLMAAFNNIPENGLTPIIPYKVRVSEPLLDMATPEQKARLPGDRAAPARH